RRQRAQPRRIAIHDGQCDQEPDGVRADIDRRERARRRGGGIHGGELQEGQTRARAWTAICPQRQSSPRGPHRASVEGLARVTSPGALAYNLRMAPCWSRKVGRTMATMLVLYNTPEDAAAFDQYYTETHTPIALKMPGLRSMTVSKGAVSMPRGASP